MRSYRVVGLVVVMAAVGLPSQASAGGWQYYSGYVLKPAGGSGISGIAFSTERARRIRLHTVLTDAQQFTGGVPTEAPLTGLAAGPCGQPAGRILGVSLEHVAGRGLEYSGQADTPGSMPITRRARSLRVQWDIDNDGTYDDTACARNRVLGTYEGRTQSVAEFRGREGRISGIALVREQNGRVTMRLAVTDDNVPPRAGIVSYEWEFSYITSSGLRCFVSESRAGLDTTLTKRTSVRRMSRGITHRLPRLRAAWDLNDDGQYAETAAVGTKYLRYSEHGK